MGYVVRKVCNKKRKWRVQYCSRVGGKQQWRDVRITELASLGFHPGLTLEEACARRNQLNASDALRRREEKRHKILERLDEEQLEQNAFFPAQDLVEFERRLASRGGADKKQVHFRAAKRIVAAVAIGIQEWEERRAEFYDEFARLQWSPSYVKKVLPLINAWGVFMARKYRLPFLPIPFPRGHERERIADAYYDKKPEGQESGSISPEELESLRSSLKEKQYAWIWVSLWFGLRPMEVDQLLKASGPKTWSIERVGKVDVLCVYQTKLTAIPQRERTKRIPVLFREQKEALGYVKARALERPLAKTMRRYFGERVTNYAGRKSFTDLMLGMGQKLEDISAWLGHRTIDRTWQDYKNREKVSWTEPT